MRIRRGRWACAALLAGCGCVRAEDVAPPVPVGPEATTEDPQAATPPANIPDAPPASQPAMPPSGAPETPPDPASPDGGATPAADAADDAGNDAADDGGTPQDLPTIRDIVFEGNRITRPITMQREIVIHAGEPANPKKIERSRQAIQDLGLFREVKVRTEPVEDGVRVVFEVREKWYVIPIPRLEVNSEGDTGYGLQMRWNNLWGLNHRWEMLAVRREYQRKDRDSSISLFSNYDIPFLGEGRNAINLSGAYVDQNSRSDEGVDYREQAQSLGAIYSRALSDGPKSQGWKIGGGLRWQNQSADGEGAPQSYGHATGLTSSISYRSQHDHLYSETGRTFGTQVGFAAEGLASDYGYLSHVSSFSDERRIGSTPHQTLRFEAMVGGYYGGPDSREPKAFEFGGSTQLRGYDRERIQGDVAYYGAVTVLRPLHWDWLRVFANLEAGSALDSYSHPGGKLFYASLGVGVTVRVTWLVNVEFEAGVAYPLVPVPDMGLRPFAVSL